MSAPGSGASLGAIRKQRYRTKHKRLGLCVNCPRPVTLYGLVCNRCRLWQRQWKQRTKGCRPWREGAQGGVPWGEKAMAL